MNPYLKKVIQQPVVLQGLIQCGVIQEKINVTFDYIFDNHPTVEKYGSSLIQGTRHLIGYVHGQGYKLCDALIQGIRENPVFSRILDRTGKR